MRNVGRQALTYATIALLLTTSTPIWADGDSDRAQAIELAKESKAAYRDGRFRRAAELLEEAYALDPAPTLLFNLARSLESAGDLEGAVDAYRRYLTSDPEARDRGAIEKRIANMTAQIDERARLAEERDRERARREAAERSRKDQKVTTPIETTAPSRPVLPWIVTGVGVAGVATGVALGLVSRSRHDTAQQESVQQNAAVFQDEAESFAFGANIAYAAGGTILATGLVWGIMSLLADEPPPAKTALVIHGNAFRAGLGFQF